MKYQDAFIKEDERRSRMEPNRPYEFSLDQLASETLALSESMSSLFKEELEGFDRDFDFNYQRSLHTHSDESEVQARAEQLPGQSDDQSEDHHSLADFPEAPGVVYHLQIGVSTFAIRAIATADIDETMIYLRSGEPSLLAALKLSASEDEFQDLSNIGFFETESLELAQMVTDQLANRRFPRIEDQLCNLSDPGFSWWLKEEENKFTIYYKSHGLGREERFLKLGPVGDRMIHSKRMQSLRPLLQGLFPIKEWVSTDKVFSVECVGNHPGFELFKRLFTHGQWPKDHAAFGANRLGVTLYLHLQEVSTMRAFWAQVDSEVKA